MFFDLRTPIDKVVRVLSLYSSGMGLNAVCAQEVYGKLEQVKAVFARARRSQCINTDYVESRNGKLRKDSARLIRKSLCHSKRAIYHDAHLRWLRAVMNLTRTVDDLKQLINPEAKRFEQKYRHRSPAMAQGLIDRELTIKDLLFVRPSPVP